jgi:hypothetical protein
MTFADGSINEIHEISILVNRESVKYQEKESPTVEKRSYTDLQPWQCQ